MTRRPGITAARQLALIALWFVASCGTDAIGVGSCREIETARCEAAEQCGLIEDADSCRQFYRDHCLHGVATQDAPRRVEVRECASAIEAAGRCAAREGANTPPDDCGSSALEGADARRVCDIVEEPERAPDCAFLDERPRDEDDSNDEDDESASDSGSDTSIDAG